MEPKVIVYIVVGILYFLYSVGKKAQEKKEPAAPDDNTPPVSKPVSPPVSNPLEEIMREVKRKQAEADAKKKLATPQPKPLTSFQQKKQPQKEILIHEKKKGIFEAGNYERDLTDEEITERGKLKIENEGIYKIKTVEEMEAEEENAFDFDARNAIIGSLILEKKF